MRTSVIICFLLLCLSLKASDSLQLRIDTIFVDEIVNKETARLHNLQTNIFYQRLDELDKKSPMDLAYNEKVQPFIDNYLGNNKLLIARMQGLSPYYFSIFEQMLDKYDLPLELKYLPIVESALNPKAKSHSGASGLWQFMYLTGKQYGLNVSSYIDERQDPIKSTEAACIYFLQLYDMFGDWNLVLAAYNGGPGYLTRAMAKTGLYDYWELRPYLRRETRGYVPAFVAVNYVMNYYKEYGIEIQKPESPIIETDTITLKMQMDFSVLSELICLPKETIGQLNPSITKNIFPKNTNITLPKNVMLDFVINEQAIYTFVEAVEQKEILTNESRLVYVVKPGDYLGKIAQENGMSINDIRKWNKLKNDNLSIGGKLVLFIKDDFKKAEQKKIESPVYIVKQGDTLWDIANKYEGISVSELIKHNNLNSNQLKPGEKILLPTG